MNVLMRSSASLKYGTPLVLALAVFLPQISRSAQPTVISSTVKSSDIARNMKTFVIIFRQSPRLFTDTDKQRRAEETAIWARRQNDAGHKLHPHILAPESAYRGPENPAASPSGVWPITALLFLEAQDLSEAAHAAESHPALRYGANVEVRPWSPPSATAPPVTLSPR
jgi:hypothetical protein